MICRNVHRFAAVRRLGLAALSATMRKSGISMMLAALWLCASGSLSAQTFTTVFSFDGANGSILSAWSRPPMGTSTGQRSRQTGRSSKSLQAAR